MLPRGGCRIREAADGGQKCGGGQVADGRAAMPRKSHPAAKPQAETPLTPARSFRDEGLLGCSGQLLGPCGMERAPRGRSANNSTTDSACRRRATNVSTCAEDRSNHWASSIKPSRGRFSAASDSRPSTTRLTRTGRAAPVLNPHDVAMHRVAVAAATRGRPAWACTTDAGRQREAPSPTRPRPPGQPGSPGRARPRNPARLSYLCVASARLNCGEHP